MPIRTAPKATATLFPDDKHRRVARNCRGRFLDTLDLRVIKFATQKASATGAALLEVLFALFLYPINHAAMTVRKSDSVARCRPCDDRIRLHQSRHTDIFFQHPKIWFESFFEFFSIHGAHNFIVSGSSF